MKAAGRDEFLAPQKNGNRNKLVRAVAITELCSSLGAWNGRRCTGGSRVGESDFPILLYKYIQPNISCTVVAQAAPHHASLHLYSTWCSASSAFSSRARPWRTKGQRRGDVIPQLLWSIDCLFQGQASFPSPDPVCLYMPVLSLSLILFCG